VRIALGGDHAGLEMKNTMAAWLREDGHELLDLGAHKMDPLDDYPDFALAVAESVATGQAQRGIIVCGSGVGASIAANKIPGVRAAMCHDVYSAHQGVEHDDMNVLCLGGRVVGVEVARELVRAFLGAKYSNEARHQRRLNKVLAAERRALQGKA